MLLSAAALEPDASAACDASITVVAVTVGRGLSVEPDASTVTSVTLLTVLLVGVSETTTVDVVALVTEVAEVAFADEAAALPSNPRI